MATPVARSGCCVVSGHTLTGLPSPSPNPGDVVLARKLQRGTQILVNFLHQSTRYGPAGCNVNKAIMELRLRQQAGLLDPAARAAAAAAGKRTIFALGARAPVPRVTDAGLDLLEKDLAAIGFFTEEWA